MRTVLAIAHLTIRTAIRLRVFVSLFLLIAAVVVVVPRSLVGDGSAASDVRILLSHTLGLASIILSLATLWASCASVSQEVSGMQIRLLAVKPVPPSQLWLGKWLGIVLLDTVLLVVVSVAVWLSLDHTLRAPRWTEADRDAVRAEVLVSRQRFLPADDGLSEEVSRRFLSLKERGQLPADVPECDVLSELTRVVSASRSAVAAGRSRSWRIEVPERSAGRALSLRFRLVSAIGGAGTVAGTWFVGTEENPKRFAHEVTRAKGGKERVSIPLDTVVPGEGVVVTFSNRAKPHSMTAILPGDDSLELLVESGGFAMNYIRAVLVILAVLAVLAALGVTAGTFFSFPVATFAAFSVALILVMAHFFVAGPEDPQGCGHAGHDHHNEEPSLLSRTSGSVLRAVAFAAAPIDGIAPLGSLCDGIAVPWRRVGVVWLAFGLMYPFGLCVVGSWCLRRRELAA